MTQQAAVTIAVLPNNGLRVEWQGSSRADQIGTFALRLACRLVANQREAGERDVTLVLQERTEGAGLWAAVLRQTIAVHARYSVRHCHVMHIGHTYTTAWDSVLPGSVSALAHLAMAVMRHTAHKVSRTEGLSLKQVVRAVGNGRAPTLSEALVATTVVQHTMGIGETLGQTVHRNDHLTHAIDACTAVRDTLAAGTVVRELSEGAEQLANELRAVRSPYSEVHAPSFVAALLAGKARPGQLWGGPALTAASRERQQRPVYAVLFPPSDGDWVQVRWNDSRFVDARVESLRGDGILAEDIAIDPHWASVYDYRDACEAARAAGEPLPSANTALSAAQRTTLAALSDDWTGTTRSASSRFPKDIQKFIVWNSVRVTSKESGGVVYCELRGYQNGGPESGFGEHGTEATLLGNRVYFAADDDPLPMTVEGPRSGRKRLGPKATTADVTAYNRPRPTPNVARKPMPDDVDAARDVFLDAFLKADDAESAALLAGVRWWAASHPVPLPAGALSASIRRLRELVDARVFTVPLGLLHAASNPEQLRAAAALGADLNGPQREGGSARNTPLMRHRRDLACFETLLELGADPRTMLDESGGLFRPLDPPQHAAFTRALAKHGLALASR